MGCKSIKDSSLKFINASVGTYCVTKVILPHVEVQWCGGGIHNVCLHFSNCRSLFLEVQIIFFRLSARVDVLFKIFTIYFVSVGQPFLHHFYAQG